MDEERLAMLAELADAVERGDEMQAYAIRDMLDDQPEEEHDDALGDPESEQTQAARQRVEGYTRDAVRARMKAKQ